MPRSSTEDHIGEVLNDLDRQVYILKIVMVKGSIFLEISSDIFLFIFWCSSLFPTMFGHLPTMVFTCIQFCLMWNVVLCVCTLKKSVEFAPGNPRLLG